MARGSSSRDRRSAPAPHQSRGAEWGGSRGGTGRDRTDSSCIPSRLQAPFGAVAPGVWKDANPWGLLHVIGIRQPARPTCQHSLGTYTLSADWTAGDHVAPSPSAFYPPRLALFCISELSPWWPPTPTLEAPGVASPTTQTLWRPKELGSARRSGA